MISDDIFERTQADVLAALQACPHLDGIQLMADDKGDIQARVRRALGTAAKDNDGRRGLVIVVLQPEVAATDENLPGPPVTLSVEIRALENVLRNRNPDRGTGVRASVAAVRVLAALHLRGIGSSVLYAEDKPVQPLDTEDGHVEYAVKLRFRPAGITAPEKCAAVMPSEADDIITLECTTEGAEIYYTTDGTYPTPTNGTLYTAPLEGVTVGLTFRCAAYAEGLNPGDCTEFLTVLPANTTLDGDVALTDADGSFITDP